MSKEWLKKIRFGFEELIKDAQRLDFLQSLTDKEEYTGKVILRKSKTGRGWRLHETSKEGAEYNVRKAIDNFIKENE